MAHSKWMKVKRVVYKCYKEFINKTCNDISEFPKT